MLQQIWRAASNPLVRCYSMLAVVAVMTCVAPDAWAADYFNGKAVYDKHCQSCHGVGGQSAVPGTPDFSRGEALFRSDSDVYRAIRQGKGAMPAYRGILSEDEARDVVAFLRSLQK